MFDWIARVYSELSKRNVPKALLLYVGTSWALIGVLDIVLPIMGAPDDLMEVALLIAAGGFVVTGLVSWAFELTDAGWIRESLRASKSNRSEPPLLQKRSVDYIIIGSLTAALLLSLYNNLQSSNELDRSRSLSKIQTLAKQDRYVEAFEIAKTLHSYGVDDSTISSITEELSAQISISTEPPGAEVYVRVFGTDQTNDWQYLGKSPILERVLAKGVFEWRFVREGFAETTRVERNPGFLIGSRDVAEIGNPGFRPELSVQLAKVSSHPVTTVAIPGGSTFTTPYFGMGLATKELPEFDISKYEITNEQYMQFVAADGYKKESLWPDNFLLDGEAIPFSDAVDQFVDSTGRSGPSTWSYGKYAADSGKQPVSGISWYEARAFANFIGGSLPSVYQFGRAAFSPNEVNAPLRPHMINGSNFSSTGKWSTETDTSLSPYGAYDLLGNVREWTANGQRNTDMKFALGGSWAEPPYTTMSANRIDAWDRAPENGLRIAFNKNGSAVDVGPINTFADLTVNKMTSPIVSDDEFDSFRWAFQTTDVPLNPTIEETLEAEHWTRKQVSIEVGQGNERMSIYLYLPKDVEAPYQPILFFPGYTAFAPETISKDSVDTEYPFPNWVMRGGRALVFPVIKGAYERYDGQLSLNSEQQRQNQVTRRLAWIREIGRVIDYLETDSNFEASQVGYLGISFGASRSLPVLAVEPRLRAAILLSGGISYFDFDEKIPAIGRIMNYVERIKIPVLMINGRYDNIISPAQQKLLFERLGTPSDQKKLVKFDTGHWPFPHNQMVSEILGWMDTYLGEIKR